MNEQTKITLVSLHLLGRDVTGLKRLLEKYDHFYWQSDSGAVYSAGNAVDDEIKAECKRVGVDYSSLMAVMYVDMIENPFKD